jgi:hypothetical protein
MLDCSREEVTGLVDRLVQELLEAAGCQQPPVDALQLAQQHLGIEVCVDGRQPSRGRAQKSGGGKQIYLRPEPSAERRQWTVAHEIGEHLRPQLLGRLGAGETPVMTGESLANLFAYRLLVPTCWFAEDARNLDYDLPELKQRYGTASHEVIAWRMLDLPEPCVITIVDNEHVSRRRSNAWPVTRQLAGAERTCLEYVHSYSRARRIQADGWTVYGWPVHQPDWRREILRSVYEE